MIRVGFGCVPAPTWKPSRFMETERAVARDRRIRGACVRVPPGRPGTEGSVSGAADLASRFQNVAASIGFWD